jgi:ATP-dependent DNA ligase
MSKKLGIYNSIKGSKKNGEKSKEDYIIPIREKILRDRYNGETPLYLSLLLENVKSPMLAKRFDEIKEDIQKEVWDSSDWYFEEKIDGLRCFLVKIGNDIKVFSREMSRHDLLPIEIPVPINLSSSINYNFILDCELTSDNINTLNILNGYGLYSEKVTQSLEELLIKLNPIMSKRILRENDFKFNFNIFDCLYLNKSWIMNFSLEKRRLACMRVVSSLKSSVVNCRLVNTTNQDKEWFYNSCLKSGYEGCVCKRIDSIYVPDTARRKDGWIKIKSCHEVVKDIVDDRKVYDTIDGFITGFNAGKNSIESLEISAFVDGKQQVITWVDTLDDFMKSYVTFRVEDVITIKPEVMNCVVELDGMLTTIMRFRFDKSPQECSIKGGLIETIKSYK